MKKLNEIFDLSYGNKLDLNKMDKAELEKNEDYVNFISRTSRNLGVVAKIKKIDKEEPYPKGSITVALGGAILSSFVQQHKFYTAQNIMVLSPKEKMTLQERIYYCKCIELNKFRYATFGREANRTLKDLELPDSVPNWVNEKKVLFKDVTEPLNKNELELHVHKWGVFSYDDVFIIKKGKRLKKRDQKEGEIPYISSSSLNNGVDNYISNGFTDENCITFASYGSIGEVFYQKGKVWVSDNASALYLKDKKLNPLIAMFILTILRLEQFRFSYGMTAKKGRLGNFKIKLPTDKNDKPDWDFMEDYIKSLKYSKELSKLNT